MQKNLLRQWHIVLNLGFPFVFFILGKGNAEDAEITGYRKMTTNASGTFVNMGGLLFLPKSK
jgi:hypothetical protein